MQTIDFHFSYLTGDELPTIASYLEILIEDIILCTSCKYFIEKKYKWAGWLTLSLLI